MARQVFGSNRGEDNSSVESDPYKKLGVKKTNQAPEDKAASKGEPVNATEGNTARQLNQQQQPVRQEQLNQKQTPEEQLQQEPKQQDTQQQEQVDETKDDYQRKVEYIKDKFNSPEEFEKSVQELENKLGVESDKTLKTEEEAVNYYMQLEEQMGNIGQQTGNVDQTVQRLSQLEQKNQMLATRNQRLLSKLRKSRANKQPRDNQGKFTQRQQPNQNNQQQQTQQPQQNNQQVQTQQSIEDTLKNVDIDISPREFTSELYKSGPNSEKFKKAVAEISSKLPNNEYNELKNEINQLKSQVQQQTQQKQKQEQSKRLYQTYKQKMDNLKQKYGEQEVNRLMPDMKRFLNNNSFYLNPNLMPNGFERAFNEVRNRNQQYTQQQQTQQQQNQQNIARKQTANIPNQNNNSRQYAQRQTNMTPDEQIKAQMFNQGRENKSGIFG